MPEMSKRGWDWIYRPNGETSVQQFEVHTTPKDGCYISQYLLEMIEQSATAMP